MVFRVNDETLSLVKLCYEKSRDFLSPTTKILEENLIFSLQATRTVTSSYEADLLIAILLPWSRYSNDVLENERDQHMRIQAKDYWREENTYLNLYQKIRINQVIEQLRLFTKSMEVYTKDCSNGRSR